MSKTLGNAIKQLSQAVNEQGKPTDIRYGTVVSTSPLKVQISAELTLPQSVLVVPQSLTNYTVDVTMNWSTDSHTHTHTITDTYMGGGSASNETHNHSLTGKKTITIHNGLKVGDKVLLLRQQGGQSYIILDKI